MGDKRRRIVVICIAVLILIGTFLSTYVAGYRARGSAKARAENVLLDSAREQAAAFALALNGRFEALQGLSTMLSMSGETGPAAIEAQLAAAVDSAELSFASVDLLFADGAKATGDDSYDIHVTDRAYFQAAIAGERGMERIAGRLTGRACIVLAVPYYRDGRAFGVLRGLYYEEELRTLLVSQAYAGDGYSLLVSGNGDIIVNAESVADLVTDGNILDTLGRAFFLQGDSLEEMEADLAAGRSGTLHYDYNESARIAVLMPLGSERLPENDWFVFNIVYEKHLLAEIQTSRRDSIESIMIFAAFSVAALLLFLVLERDHRQKKERETESTRQREEQFRIVTKQSGKFVLRYDIPTHTAYMSEGESDGFEGAAFYEDAAEAIIARGYVDPSAAADYRAFFRRVDAGDSPVTADILMQRPNGARRWYRHISTTIFDRDGDPKTAIISYYDNTEQRERELAYAKWQQELESLSYEDAALYEWNLTKDTCEGARGRLVMDYSDLPADTFNARAARFSEDFVFGEDRAAYAALMNRERLIAQYFGKNYRSGLDYRFVSADGSLHWRRISIQLVPYPDTQDIKAYVTNRDIDSRKREALALLARSQQDYLTGALNRETFIDRVNGLVGQSRTSAHALLMLDIDGFKHVNDTLGHDAGDRVLSEFVGNIRTVLRASDIVGRIGGDEFMVCLPDMPFDAAIARKAEQLCMALRRRLGEQLTISVSVGIAVCPRDGTDFDALYRCADAALYHAKGRGKDSYAFYQKGMESGAALTEIDAPSAEETAAAKQRTVLIASDSDGVYDSLVSMLSPRYGVRRLDGADDAAGLPGGTELQAAILDTDSPLGCAVLRTAGKRLIESGVTLFAVTSDKSEGIYVRLMSAGVDFAFFKPVNREVLLLRLERLYSTRSAERTRLQSTYRRLQTTEDMRYREVLTATGTTVFVYDITTQTYQADLLAEQMTVGAFEGRSLGREMMEKGILDRADVEAIRADMTEVEQGRTQRASRLARLTTRDGGKRWFRIQVMRMENTDTLTPKLLITASDVNEQAEAEAALRFRAERDALTGLYNREAFLERASALIAQHAPGYYVMACFNIDNFKVINDQYGIQKGDEVLIYIANIFQSGFEGAGGVCCRVMADNFAVLYPQSFADSEEIAEVRRAATALDGSIQPITFSIGRYLVNDLSLTVSAMLDRASLAEASVKGRFDARIAQYDESMRERILEEQEILNEMNAALEQGQFELWFQPQYNHATGALTGAEALVRWRHKKRGLILPGDFIPVFERNGFIYEMDKHIWERACALLRGWLDAGETPLPLSVNISRCDVFRKDFYAVITGLVEKYRIPVNLLRLEITESAFAKSTEQIIEVVKRLTRYGFIVEIDDFGSGYSSLNTLKDVPANTLKLDMRFLESTGNSTRGGNILESVVRMAKRLGMPVIAEGVETRAQADYLRSIGCCHVQGYLYAPPMPLADYELLAAGSRKEQALAAFETVDALDNDAFWDPNSMETLIFNSYVGGACIFEYNEMNGNVELLRANEKYAQALGGDRLSVGEALAVRLPDIMDAQNLAALMENVRHAVADGGEATCEACVSGLPGCPEPRYIRSTVRVIARTGALRLCYCAITNVTAQRMAERKLRETSEQLWTIMDNVNSGVTATVLRDGVPVILFANDRYFEQLGYTRAQFASEVRSAFELICPEDRAAVMESTRQASLTRVPFACEYRAVRRDGSSVWLQSSVSITAFPGVTEPVQLAVANNATAQRAAGDARKANA